LHFYLILLLPFILLFINISEILSDKSIIILN
jgi:hypothetical protein